MKFNTVFDPAPDKGIECEGESLTQQQYRDMSDINWIIAHYQDPAPVDPRQPAAPRVPLFGDFSNVPDLGLAHSIIQQAEAAFDALPADVRLRFNNNPLEMMMFAESASPAERKAAFGDQAPLEDVNPAAPSSVNQGVNSEQIKNS